MSVYYDKTRKRWRVEVTRNGKRTRAYAPEGASRQEAEAWEAQIVLDAFRQEKLGQKPERTLAEAIKRWADEDLPHLKSENAQRNHAAQLLPFIGAFKLSEVHECAAEYVRKNTALRPATIYQRLSVLRHVARLAYKNWEWIDQPVHQKIKMPSVKNARHVYASYDEVLTLLIAAETQELEDLVLIAFFTGMRRGEIMQLDQTHVRGDNFFLHDLDKMKTDVRTVPILPVLQDAVQRLPIRRSKDWATAAFANLADRCGLGHYHLHDLRHSFASALVQNDVDIYLVSALLGHASVKTTQRYAHLNTEGLRSAMSKALS